jgi:hypothetical protein
MLRADEYNRANLEAAADILADPQRYGAGMTLWAERVRRRLAAHRQPTLFDMDTHPSNDLLTGTAGGMNSSRGCLSPQDPKVRGFTY